MFGTFALVLALTAAAPEPALPRPQLVVNVRHEGRIGLSAELLGRITRTVQDLWRPYAEIAFSTPDRPIGAFRRDDELTLVITDRLLPNHGVDSLGWIEFVNGHPMRTVTVSVTAARLLLEGSRWEDRPLLSLPTAVWESFLVAVLGRGIAHEVGHYLLRSPDHTPKGLMRARFTAADILWPKRGVDGLDAHQLVAVQRHLLEFAAAVDDPEPVW